MATSATAIGKACETRTAIQCPFGYCRIAGRAGAHSRRAHAAIDRGPGHLAAALFRLHPGVTYSLLHGSWMHFGVNAVWLLAFGSAVARRFGAMRFLAFFAVTAAAGAAMHLLTNSGSQAPMIGASASISGAMAAAMRFAFQRGGPLGALRGGDDDAFRPRLAIDHRRQRGRCLASPYRRLSRRVVAVFLVRSQADAAAIHQRWPDIALG